jgi:hypothetical protein
VLKPGESCVAALARPLADAAADEPPARNKPLLERLDFAIDSWDAAWEAKAFRQRVLCWWRTVVPDPGAPKRNLVDDTVLLDLFERLEHDPDEQRRSFRFVLGLILLRRRKLRLIGRETEGEETFWVFKRVGGGEDAPLHRAIDPRLSEADADEIAEQLSEIIADES